MKPPWWFCNGWWSPWCVIDIIAHRLGLPLNGTYYWVCRKHDEAAERHLLAAP